jgi:hypothetical protein
MRFGTGASCAVLLVSVLLLLGETTARAAASARLFYGRSPGLQGCPDEADLRRAIAERVGYDPIFAIAPNSVAVSITRDGDQIVAEVKLTNRKGMLAGSRTLRAPLSQCSELTATIALTVAIALDTIEKATSSGPPQGASRSDAAEPARVPSRSPRSYLPRAHPRLARTRDGTPAQPPSGRVVRWDGTPPIRRESSSEPGWRTPSAYRPRSR